MARQLLNSNKDPPLSSISPSFTQEVDEEDQVFFSPNENSLLSPKMSSSNNEIPDFILWVKEEPFLMGVLSPNPCAKIGVNVLRKVAEYCREKDGYQPELSLLHWGHISKYKLQLPVELSWSFLRMFDILMKPLDSYTDVKKKPDEWDGKCEEIRVTAVDQFNELKLDTLKFLLFLFIQNHARLQKKVMKRTSSSFDDPWPSSPSTPTSPIPNGQSPSPGNGSGPKCSPTLLESSSPNVARGLKTSPSSTPTSSSPGSKRRQIPEQQQIEFVTTNLEDIIDFLCLAIKGTHSIAGSGTGDQNIQNRDQGQISVKIVRALTLILGAASVSPHDKEFKSLEECLVILPEVALAVDYDRLAETVDKNKFIGWIKSNLKLNPWGPSSAPVPQRPVPHIPGIWSKNNNYELNRIYWNTQLYPKGWTLISSVNDQLLHLPNLKPFTSIKIHRCNNSYIYIPGAFNSITVEKCHNSTIFLGPVGKVVKFTDCSNLKVTAIGRIFILWDVIESVFHISTPCQPIINGSKNKKIQLAPYNSFYPMLESHMASLGLGGNVQKWNKPLELDSHGLPTTKSSQTNILRTEKFFNLIYPFEMTGTTVKNPIELPRNFSKRLQDMEKNVTEFRNMHQALNFNDEKRAQFNSIVISRFKTWLKEQGHYKELKGLRSMDGNMEDEDDEGDVSTTLL